MIAPYHTIRFHVAFRHEERDRKTGAVRVLDEPIASPRPDAQAIFNRAAGRWMARVYVPGDADPWKAGVEQTVSSFLPIVPYDLPAIVDIDWFFRPPEYLAKTCRTMLVPHCVVPDRDNLDKSTLDALVQGRLLYNDSSVALGTIAKWYTCGSPDVARRLELLPWRMATIDDELGRKMGAIDYRSEPGAIVRVRLFQWEEVGLKKPDRTPRMKKGSS